MHISWLGSTAIRIQSKTFDKDVFTIIDPYKPAKGNFPRSLTPDIGLYTRGEKDSITLSGNPFTLSTPGECETKGVLIVAVQGHEAGQIMLRVDSEGVSIAHLGLIKKELQNKHLEILSGVDVLIVPVGGGDTYNAEQAVKAVNAIEPRIVIPMAYKSDNDPKADDVNKFLEEMGIKDITPEKKIILKKRDLPQEETQVVVLSKE
ncbi:MAG: MBL fold metallo-hydrolase [Candidatus Magasanikbacteria bacterium]